MFDESQIRRLAGHRGRPVVTSLYLTVAGRRPPAAGRRPPRPSDVAARQTALVCQARRQAAALGAEAVGAVEGDVHQAGTCAAVDGPSDPVERRVDTDVELGGFDRQRHQHEHDHCHRVAAAVGREMTGDLRLWLVLAGPARSVQAVEAALPASLHDRLAGTVSNPPPAARRLTATAARAAGCSPPEAAAARAAPRRPGRWPRRLTAG